MFGSGDSGFQNCLCVDKCFPLGLDGVFTMQLIFGNLWLKGNHVNLIAKKLKLCLIPFKTKVGRSSAECLSV